jgi:hypothetical protein
MEDFCEYSFQESKKPLERFYNEKTFFNLHNFTGILWGGVWSKHTREFVVL